jgi:hypothetical protein
LLACAGFYPGPYDTGHQIAYGDCVILQEVIKQAGQRCLLEPDRGAGRPPGFALTPPRQNM